MTATERRQQLTCLQHMQQEFENLAHGLEGGVIMVSIPGTVTKHVYSGTLASRVARSIARTLEQERVNLLSAPRRFKN